MKRLILFIPSFLTILGLFAQDSLYHEPYRPQYHFTPAHRWIGDPCGNMRHNGRYMAYSWGAASSPDLVYWTEINNHAIDGVPKGIATFTGSVVVDKDNTAGYGADAYLAAFTSFDEQSKKQSQSIAFSHDGGETFSYYDRNPVLDIWSTEFRDPTVIWDKTNNRWVMLVAKALEKKVAFYHSKDFKHWEPLSEFGPMGDVEKSWECPDMFELPVDGNPDHKKHVLLVSVNWAREQYFVGDFDGTTFTPDSLYAPPCYVEDGLDYYASRVFQDFDSNDAPVYTLGWLNTWDYATHAPTTYGKGVWSLPREYRLKTTPDGIRLTQHPAEALKKLRADKIEKNYRLKAGVTPIDGIAPMDNVYELIADFEIVGSEPFGLRLCEGEDRRLIVSYDPASEYLTVDRTNTTDVTIPCFERIAHTKVKPVDGHLNLHCFVDKSSVEIFVNDGDKTLSMLTYAAPGQNGASLFSTGKSAKATLTAWPLKSIHARN